MVASCAGCDMFFFYIVPTRDLNQTKILLNTGAGKVTEDDYHLASFVYERL